MFTTDNTNGYSADELAILNAAYSRLIAERIDEDTDDWTREQTQKSTSDQVSNAWVEGITADEIVAKVRGGHV